MIFLSIYHSFLDPYPILDPFPILEPYINDDGFLSLDPPIYIYSYGISFIDILAMLSLIGILFYGSSFFLGFPIDFGLIWSTLAMFSFLGINVLAMFSFLGILDIYSIGYSFDILSFLGIADYLRSGSLYFSSSYLLFASALPSSFYLTGLINRFFRGLSAVQLFAWWTRASGLNVLPQCLHSSKTFVLYSLKAASLYAYKLRSYPPVFMPLASAAESSTDFGFLP